MIIDIIVIALIVIGCITGYKKGLTKILIKLAGFGVSLIVAFMLKDLVGNFLINNTGLDDSMRESIVSGLNEGSKYGHQIEDDNQFYTMIIQNIGLSEGVEKVSDYVIDFIFKTLGFIVVLFLALVVVFILQAALDLVVSLPIIDTINSLGGVVAGGILTIFQIFVIFAIFQMLTPIVPQIQNAINTTTVTKQIYYNNIVTDILSSSIK